MYETFNFIMDNTSANILIIDSRKQNATGLNAEDLSSTNPDIEIADLDVFRVDSDIVPELNIDSSSTFTSRTGQNLYFYQIIPVL